MSEERRLFHRAGTLILCPSCGQYAFKITRDVYELDLMQPDDVVKYPSEQPVQMGERIRCPHCFGEEVIYELRERASAARHCMPMPRSGCPCSC